MLEKLKSFLANDTLYLSIILILVAVSSFLLGRMSIEREVLPSISMNTVPAEIQPKSQKYVENSSEKSFVASKNGSKYHLVSCPGVSQIKESNMIFFDSEEEARAAGFQPAANCPELLP